MHQADRRKTRAAYQRMVAGGGNSLRMQHRFVGREGQVVWVDAAASLVHDAAGEASFAIAMIQDITQHKEAEAALLSRPP